MEAVRTDGCIDQGRRGGGQSSAACTLGVSGFVNECLNAIALLMSAWVQCKWKMIRK